MDAAVTFGAWLKRRRRMLDLTQKRLAQQVGCAVVTIRKFEADERKPSRELAKRLAICLKLFPEEHDEFIALARSEPSPVSAPEPVIAAPLPPFFEHIDEPSEVQRPLFVAREAELAQLDAFLEPALAGQGRVACVVGQAGSGKTALVQEFARRARQRQANLVVAGGTCNAYGGIGDPYLPFRELLELLTGDIESRRAAGTMDQLYARRLWQLMPHTIQALVEVGPDLIDVFVSGRLLAARAVKAAPVGADWLIALKRLAAGKAAEPARPELQQHNLFSQYAQVLQQLARRQPLLLLLDDLQWADAGSISLLFHLGRQLQGQRILIVGVYRPDDVALGRQDERHPLEPVIHEFQRIFGDIHVDLSRSQGRAFVEALVDSEANGLGAGFRRMLYQLTKGHALFTVEILRGMQARGDLVQDDIGRWIEGPHLDWDILPSQVEGVIAEQFSRLPTALQEVMRIAAVEGEIFTAEAIGRVQAVDVRPVVGQLSGVLDQRHRLVKSEGRLTLGPDGPWLSCYRFRHILFQRYLYGSLDEIERAHLHQAVGNALEQLHAGQTEGIAVQLARHYTAAGANEKAIPFLLQAGDQARGLYAHQAAIGLYRQALALLKEQNDYDRAARTLMKLGLTYHNAFDFQAAHQAYAEGFALWQQSGKTGLATSSQATLHPLRLVWGEPVTLDPAMAGDSCSVVIVRQLFSGLVTENPEMGLDPAVAKSWTVSADGCHYTFCLRDDASWSDGRPVTAFDFEYAWKRTLEPMTGSPTAGLLYDVKGARQFHQGQLPDAKDVGVRAHDETTLTVELAEPAGYFLHLLTHPAAYPLPRHVVEAHGEAWTAVEHLAGNGPFRLDSWERGKVMKLARNPDYFGSIGGNVNRVEVCLSDPFGPAAEKLTLYDTDNPDVVVIHNIESPEGSSIRHNYPEEYISTPSLLTRYAGFNSGRPPFNDVRVRRAFVMAVDRATWVNVHQRGYNAPATGGFVPFGMAGHSARIGLPYDPERARQILAEAGYAAGYSFPAVTCLVRSDYLPVARYLQAQWRAVLGVDIVLGCIDFSELLDRIHHNPPEIFLFGWSADYADPDNFLRVCVRQNLSNWRNKSYDCLLETARQTTNQPDRLELYRRADTILIEEAVLMPLEYGQLHLLVKPWVSKLPLCTPGGWHWQDIIIERDHRQHQPPPTGPAGDS